MKKVSILGSTGSIGRNAIDVILSMPEAFSIQALTANNDVAALAEQAIRLDAKYVAIGNPELYGDLKARLAGKDIDVNCGEEGIVQAARLEADCVIAGIVGMAGLKPIIAALEQGKVVAIANKEPLVAAGALVMETMHRHKARILPIDSEHSAIFQVFDARHPEGILRVVLTASGGPFLHWTMMDMAGATPEQAVAHPNWKMGRKISVDSATMMNKGLEVIEARYLFDLPREKIDVLVHPQSVVHSMVEYIDGSVLAQMAVADMRVPISHALAWPRRMKVPGARLRFETMQNLNFMQPDIDRFPAIPLAYEALKAGQYACLAMNAANEIAVQSFLSHRIGFTQIVETVKAVLDKTSAQNLKSLEEILKLDSDTRKLTESIIASKCA